MLASESVPVPVGGAATQVLALRPGSQTYSGKGGKRRVVGMDSAGWIPLERWLERRRALAVPRSSTPARTRRASAMTPW